MDHQTMTAVKSGKNSPECKTSRRLELKMLPDSASDTLTVSRSNSSKTPENLSQQESTSTTDPTFLLHRSKLNRNSDKSATTDNLDIDIDIDHQHQQQRELHKLQSQTSSSSTAGFKLSDLTAHRSVACSSSDHNNVYHTDTAPSSHSGFLLKSRKSPMTGWHKRFFLLENGFLTYGKSAADLEQGRTHGTIDLGLSAITYSQRRRRIDVDTDDIICHLKVKTAHYEHWLSQLKDHQQFRKHEISYGTEAAPRLLSPVSSPEDSPLRGIPPAAAAAAAGRFDVRGSSLRSRSVERSLGHVSTWLMDSHGSDVWDKEMKSVQSKMFDLTTTLERLNSTASAAGSYSELSAEPITPTTPTTTTTTTPSGKHSSSRRYFVGRHKKDKAREQTPQQQLPVNSSSPNLNIDGLTVAIGCEDNGILVEEFCKHAKDVHTMLKTLCHTVTTERERLKLAVERDSQTTLHTSNSLYVQSLIQTLNETLNQNEELRRRLQRIHGESATIAGPPGPPGPPGMTGASVMSDLVVSPVSQYQSLLSIESPSEFFDATETMTSSSDEEDEVEDSASDTEQRATLLTLLQSEEPVVVMTRRRSRLPAASAQSDVRLWSLLTRNIGKDLSKLSLPVSLNEPLNALQRLCEELEYSDLLDRCSEVNDPLERMVLVSVFAVSSYSSTASRSAHKPFNPLLGETYECLRQDRGWKFIAEQVSHHPPVSACYCESTNFVCWQDMQVKTKFWGKSMEVQPTGLVHLLLPKFDGEKYSWNKATSCIHNILGGQRWVEHYGEITVTNHSLNITCKLTFVKSNFWSDKKNDVHGTIYQSTGKVVHQLFGKWNEGIYLGGGSMSQRCIWRPGAMQPDAELFYGFTRFAMELNELDNQEAHLYPTTDTRFRPDQRLLEEGKISEAEEVKRHLEELQRDRLRPYNDGRMIYSPRWFLKTVSESDNEESYVYTNKYWQLRQDPGFKQLQLPSLW